MELIPVSTPLLEGKELEYLAECINTGWISSEGPFIGQFEKSFSRSVSRDYGISVSSGSAALDIAVAALGIGKGDEVIMPAFTIISPAQSVVRAGATPVLADSDPFTWNMDVNLVEARITQRTKAIIIAHMYGLPVDMDPVMDLAKKHKLLVIEDAAEMHGQSYKGRPCGSFGDISIFSFYANKLITTGEGGMLVTNDPAVDEKCRSLRNLAFGKGKDRFIHEELGWNYRMTNLQAALGLAQLEQIHQHALIKRRIGKRYLAGLTGNRSFQLPQSQTEYAKNIYWIFGLVAESEKKAAHAVKVLADNGIATRPFFWPMHLQPVFKKMGLFRGERYPVAESLGQKGFYIPCGLGLTPEHQTRVISTIRALDANNKF